MEQGHFSENEFNGYHFVNRHFGFSPEEFFFFKSSQLKWVSLVVLISVIKEEVHLVMVPE